MTSVVKSDHKAIVAVSSRTAAPVSKTRQHGTFQPKSPSMNARFRLHLVAIDIGTTKQDPESLAQTLDPRAFVDSLYAFAAGMLDEFYSQRTITVTSCDQMQQLR